MFYKFAQTTDNQLLNTVHTLTTTSTIWVLTGRRLELFLEDSFFLDFIQKYLLQSSLLQVVDNSTLTFSGPVLYTYVLNLFTEFTYFAASKYWLTPALHTNSVLYIICTLLLNMAGLFIFCFVCLLGL